MGKEGPWGHMPCWSSMNITLLGLVGTKSPHSGRRGCNCPWMHPLETSPRAPGPGGALGATGLKMAGLGQGSEEASTSLPRPDRHQGQAEASSQAPHSTGFQLRSQVRAEGLKSRRAPGTTPGLQLSSPHTPGLEVCVSPTKGCREREGVCAEPEPAGE